MRKFKVREGKCHSKDDNSQKTRVRIQTKAICLQSVDS